MSRADRTSCHNQDRATRETDLTSRKEIKRAYKERKKPAGVFQVKNTANGKVLLGSSLNLEGVFNSHRFRLSIGRHPNRDLQKDWNEYGPDRFVFETLEVVQEKDDPNFNLSDELTLLEQIWLEKLQPFGERGYNADSHIRQV
jgi:hypothetical protein